LKTIAEIRYGLGQPPKESPDGLPLIRATNISHGHITDEDMLYVDPADIPAGRRAILSAKEIIVVRSGAYTADSAIIPKKYEGAISGYDMVVTVREANPEFIAAVLLCPYVHNAQLVVASTRSAQPHLNAEELGEALLLLPTIAEQCNIAAFLDKETARLDSLIAKVREAIKRLRELRSALISAATTGRIDVREEAGCK
jgi:type I restriction enzyme S subunit